MMSNRKYVLYLRKNDGEITCYDPTCTHLGCRIRHQPENKRYVCPCHGGVFSEEGNVISGPPPKPLDQHPVRVADGKIWVYKEV
jgi:Rieske Fe-S protein